MGYKLTLEQVKSRLPSYIKIVESSYVNTQHKAIFVDEKYGEWSARVSYLINNKYVHPKRFLDSKKVNIEEIKSKLPINVKIKKELGI